MWVWVWGVGVGVEWRGVGWGAVGWVGEGCALDVVAKCGGNRLHSSLEVALFGELVQGC